MYRCPICGSISHPVYVPPENFIVNDKFGTPLGVGDRVVLYSVESSGRYGGSASFVKGTIIGKTDHFIKIMLQNGGEVRKGPDKIIKYDWSEKETEE